MASPALKVTTFLIVAGAMLAQFSGLTKAQPVEQPSTPSAETTREITMVLSAFVEATGSDAGYKMVRPLVEGISGDGRLGMAWREWRRAVMLDGAPTCNKRLVFKGAEIEEWRPSSRPDISSRALVKIQVDIVTPSSTLAASQWPVEPWQSELSLEKSDSPEACWRFLAPLVTSQPPAFIELPERGGDHLQQALEVLRSPEAMLHTARAREQEHSLRLLSAAILRYANDKGHYPPARYFAALLGVEPEDSRLALRQAFQVAGTSRTWQFNPHLANHSFKTAGDASRTPLLWDGTAHKFYSSLAGCSIIAFADGHAERVSAPDLHSIERALALPNQP